MELHHTVYSVSEESVKEERKRVLTYHREARSVRDEGLELSRDRQAGCISAGLSSINDALSYDIHEPTQARSTPFVKSNFSPPSLCAV